MNNGVKEILLNKKGKVDGVILNDGTKISAKIVIVGVGVSPATSLVTRRETGI
jgi:NAD(P)H-nitrite reductase large subunit